MLRMNFGASYSRDLALYTQMNSWARSRNKAVSEQEKISSSCKLLANPGVLFLQYTVILL